MSSTITPNPTPYAFLRRASVMAEVRALQAEARIRKLQDDMVASANELEKVINASDITFDPQPMSDTLYVEQERALFKIDEESAEMEGWIVFGGKVNDLIKGGDFKEEKKRQEIKTRQREYVLAERDDYLDELLGFLIEVKKEDEANKKAHLEAVKEDDDPYRLKTLKNAIGTQDFKLVNSAARKRIEAEKDPIIKRQTEKRIDATFEERLLGCLSYTNPTKNAKSNLNNPTAESEPSQAIKEDVRFTKEDTQRIQEETQRIGEETQRIREETQRAKEAKDLALAHANDIFQAAQQNPELKDLAAGLFRVAQDDADLVDRDVREIVKQTNQTEAVIKDLFERVHVPKDGEKTLAGLIVELKELQRKGDFDAMEQMMPQVMKAYESYSIALQKAKRDLPPSSPSYKKLESQIKLFADCQQLIEDANQLFVVHAKKHPLRHLSNDEIREIQHRVMDRFGVGSLDQNTAKVRDAIQDEMRMAQESPPKVPVVEKQPVKPPGTLSFAEVEAIYQRVSAKFPQVEGQTGNPSMIKAFDDEFRIARESSVDLPVAEYVQDESLKRRSSPLVPRRVEPAATVQEKPAPVQEKPAPVQEKPAQVVLRDLEQVECDRLKIFLPVHRPLLPSEKKWYDDSVNQLKATPIANTNPNQFEQRPWPLDI